MNKSFSGQLRLRMPSSLHRELSEKAEQEGVSLNSYLVYLLSKNFGAEMATPADNPLSTEGILLVGAEDTLYKSQSPVVVIDPTTMQQ
ncbi:MAG: toxin-antitoxin system HicB family antitoxin [Desulfovibrio sp.]|uniref:toxin-antitoxin system HicB family antitoxin n=1 Tax=Desulfovibrio sp. 7SRBS1 TaxID=3378064 RepID=UPI003B3C6FF2